MRTLVVVRVAETVPQFPKLSLPLFGFLSIRPEDELMLEEFAGLAEFPTELPGVVSLRIWLPFPPGPRRHLHTRSGLLSEHQCPNRAIIRTFIGNPRGFQRPSLPASGRTTLDFPEKK